MSVKRALRLDTVKKANPADATPLKTKMRNLSSYSPTTGTCEMSPFSSPMSHHAQQLRNHPSDVSEAKQSTSESRVPRRGQPQAEKDEFLELQLKVNSSMDRILKLRENLQSLKALEGSRELEKIIGASHAATPLSAQLQKTRVLLSQAEELQLLKTNDAKLPAQEPARSASSAEFLRSLLQ